MIQSDYGRRYLISSNHLQLVGWILIFAALYVLPRIIQNISFYCGLMILLYAQKDALILNYRTIKQFFFVSLFIILIIFFQVLTVTVSALSALETIASILLVNMFVLAVTGLQLSSRRFFALISMFAVASVVVGVFVSLMQESTGGGFRLELLGKGRNPIQGAALLTVGIFAAILFPIKDKREGFFRYAAIVILTLGLIATFSRGPILSFFIALIAFAIVKRFKGSVILKFYPMFVFVPFILVMCIVLWGDGLRDGLCLITKSLCRPAGRQDIWQWVWTDISTHPWIGSGGSFRFPHELKRHSHNGILGMALSFGLPATLLWLSWFAALLVNNISVETLGNSFGALTLYLFPFALAYMASDLTNPYAFVGAHYLFLWLPVGLLYRNRVV